MPKYGDNITLEKSENLLTPEETKRLLEEAETIRSENSSPPQLRYPPKNGYSIDKLYEAAEKLPYRNLEDKIQNINNSDGLNTEKLEGGSMKETRYSPEHEIIYQHIDHAIVSEFTELLGQELTALHNNQVLREHDEVEPVTDYRLRFTLENGTPIPVRIGEYRELIDYHELPAKENLPEKEELRDSFTQSGQILGDLMKDGKVAYAEPVKDWEQNPAKNRAYDPIKDAVVVVDMGELSENQFTENLNNPHSIMEDFLFEDPWEAPFRSQREFLEHNRILDEIAEYFRALEDEPLSELLLPEINQQSWRPKAK